MGGGKVDSLLAFLRMSPRRDLIGERARARFNVNFLEETAPTTAIEFFLRTDRDEIRTRSTFVGRYARRRTGKSPWYK